MKLFNRRILPLLAALLLACAPLAAFAETTEEDIPLEDLDLNDIDVVTVETPLVSNPLPIDFTPGFVPQESGYLDENTYKDPTIEVHIEYKDITEYQNQKSRTAGAWKPERTPDSDSYFV